MCSGREGEDFDKVYKNIRLKSRETKYKSTQYRNKILSSEIREFVPNINISERCTIMNNRNLSDLPESFTINKSKVSEFFYVLLDIGQDQNKFKKRELEIIMQIKETPKGKNILATIENAHILNIKGRKKRIFKTFKMNNQLQ